MTRTRRAGLFGCALATAVLAGTLLWTCVEAYAQDETPAFLPPGSVGGSKPGPKTKEAKEPLSEPKQTEPEPEKQSASE